MPPGKNKNAFELQIYLIKSIFPNTFKKQLFLDLNRGRKPIHLLHCKVSLSFGKVLYKLDKLNI